MLGSITVMSDHSNKQWRKKVDKLTTVFGTLLNHLSKVFDCLNPELLLVDLCISWFEWLSLKLMKSYLKKRNVEQHTRRRADEISFVRHADNSKPYLPGKKCELVLDINSGKKTDKFVE